MEGDKREPRVIKLRGARADRTDVSRPRRLEPASGPVMVGDAVDDGRRRFMCVGERMTERGEYSGARGKAVPAFIPATWRMLQWEAPCLGCGAAFQFWRAASVRPIRRKCGPCKEAKHAGA